MKSRMKYIDVTEPGPPENLKVAEGPVPEIGSEEVLLRVHATALNRADTYQRQGQYPPPEGASEILGLEAAGTIEAVGSAVSSWERGAEVMALLSGGGYAEYVAVDAGLLMPKPEGLSFAEAAAIPEVFLTAYQALYWLASLEEAQHVLIHAGASGVGTAATQLVTQAGAVPHVTASAGKHTLCLQLGAETAIDYEKEDFSVRIRQVTNDHGADIIVDFVGASYAEKNSRALALDGTWVVLALMGGATVEQFPLGRLFRKRGTIVTSTLRSRSISYKRTLAQDFVDTHLQFFDDGRLAPVIDNIMNFSDVQAAHERMEANKNAGKIVLTLQ